jgi:DNA-binding NarL/FixJ family response regulator
MTQPRVFLVDDHELVRFGIRSAIEDAVEIVGEADEVDAAIELILERVPDVVLLDVHIPHGGGRAILHAVRSATESVRFLALSVSDSPDDVISTVRAGARGYVTKSISGGELVDAIYRVLAGDAVFSPRLAGFVLDAFARTGEESLVPLDDDLDQLTTRERETLRLIARGYPYRDVAVSMGISVKTVESHVSSVLRKLQLSNRHQLSVWAADRDLR